MGITVIAGLLKLHASKRSSYLVQTHTSSLLLCPVFLISIFLVPEYFGASVIQNPIAERWIAYFKLLLWYVTLFTFVLIATCRYLAIHRYQIYDRLCCKSKVFRILISIWIVSLVLVTAPKAFPEGRGATVFHFHITKAYQTIFPREARNDTNETSSSSYGELVWNEAQRYMALTFHILFTFGTCSCYAVLLNTLRRRRGRIGAGVPPSTLSETSGLSDSLFKHHARLTMRFGLATSIFMISTWLAFAIEFFPGPETAIVKKCFLYFSVSNSLFDSLTLLNLNNPLRRELARSWFKNGLSCLSSRRSQVVEVELVRNFRGFGVPRAPRRLEVATLPVDVQLRYHP